MSDEPLAKGKLVSKEVLQAYLDRQPEHRHTMLANVKVAGEEVVGLEVLTETTQLNGQPPVVLNTPDEK
jgi:hypothetical protein